MPAAEGIVVDAGQPDEAPAIFALLSRGLAATSLPLTVYRDPRAVSFVADLLARAEPEVFVARDGPDLLGLAHVVRDGPRLHLNHIAVDEPRRGRGIGGILLAAFESAGRARNCPALALDVFERERATVAWYSRHGYRVVDRHLHLRLPLDRPAPLPPGWSVDADALGAAEASVASRGFGRVEVACGARRLVLGLLGDEAVRLVATVDPALDEAVSVVRALFSGSRRELVVLHARERPSMGPGVVVEEILRMEKPS